MKNQTKYFQQGDVLLIRVEKESLKKSDWRGNTIKPNRNSILQHGEATGHAHRVQGNEFRVWENDDAPMLGRFLEVKKQSALSHEEHKTIIIPRGIYEIRIVREYDHFQKITRKVRD